jgi:phosphoglycerate dehydrogenase-like enzyme
MNADQRRDSRRPQVLICDKIADVGVQMLRDRADVEIQTGLTAAELMSIVPDYDAIVVRSATNVTAEVIERALNLKIIARAGSGLDNIDVVAAREREIAVVNSPDANTLSVAEYTMGLLLSLARSLPRADLSLKEGKWDKSALLGKGLSGRTLGIVGFGRIGREVAVRAQAFGMKILVNQRRPTPELNLVAGVETVDLHELLERSDFVTLHVPITDETRGMLGPEELKRMKRTAYLINTARGGVIDEPALLNALDDGQIAGAALDVFLQEPAIDSALAQHDRVIATPHIAASTEDAQYAAAVAVAEQLLDFFEEVEVETVLPLRVVATELVVLHEHIDPKRVARLAGRLERDGILQNPPVVTRVDNRYMVLDGATRTAAIKQLGIEHIIVQVISSEEELGLRTWFHVIQQIDVNQLVRLLDDLPDVSLEVVEADKATELMFEYGGLCYMQAADGRVFLVHAAPGVNRLDALNNLTNLYIDAAYVERTLSSDIYSLQYEFPEMAALVVFPEYTVTQVMQATTSSGRFFPAGITRFLIPGRVLRLNADLGYLRSENSLQEKNRWLHEILKEKQLKGGIRYYAEPVFLLDE